MKTCTKCLIEQPLSCFTADNRRPGGKCSRCNTCKAQYQRERRHANPQLAIERYWSNPLKERERHLVRKYGITEADYQALFKKQKGRCAICEKTQERAFDVDHCHQSKKVRGLLCTSCNRMLGHAGDSPKNLARAISYLDPSLAAEVIGAWMDCEGSLL